MAGKARGEMCEKHPQLEGLRYLPAWSCVGCTKENSRRLYKLRTVEMPKELAALRAKLERIQALAFDSELERDNAFWYIDEIKDVLQPLSGASWHEK
jgi:hypothetical protein